MEVHTTQYLHAIFSRHVRNLEQRMIDCNDTEALPSFELTNQFEDELAIKSSGLNHATILNSLPPLQPPFLEQTG